jgi:ferredoxin
MIVRVDNTVCMANGTCTRLLPEVFEIGDDGYVQLHGDLNPMLIPSVHEEAVVRAEANCPAGAITVELDSPGGARDVTG